MHIVDFYRHDFPYPGCDELKQGTAETAGVLISNGLQIYIYIHVNVKPIYSYVDFMGQNGCKCPG